MADAKISELVGAATPLAGTEVLPIVQGATTKKVSVASLTDGRSVNTGQLTVTNATGGATTANYLTVRGSVADNSNYPGIELQGGSLYQAGRAPKLQLANAGLGVGLYSGYINATFTAQYGIYMDSSIGLSLLSSTSGVPSARLSVSDVGNVTVNTGNLVIGTSGQGIDFSATAGTGTSELFSDYEEGTWVPVVSSTSGTITSYTVNSARYTKIGRVVSLSCQIPITNNGTGAGALFIQGFPFANSVATCGVIYNQSTGHVGSVTVSTSATDGYVAKYDGTYPVATGQTIQFSLTYGV